MSNKLKFTSTDFNFYRASFPHQLLQIKTWKEKLTSQNNSNNSHTSFDIVKIPHAMKIGNIVS